jgi:hypothetical protein
MLRAGGGCHKAAPDALVSAKGKQARLLRGPQGQAHVYLEPFGMCVGSCCTVAKPHSHHKPSILHSNLIPVQFEHLRKIVHRLSIAMTCSPSWRTRLQVHRPEPSHSTQQPYLAIMRSVGVL